MTEFPGPFTYEGFFFINRITPGEKRITDKIRLPEKIKLFSAIKGQRDNITVRLFIQNTIVLKPVLTEDSKPMASLASPIEQLPPVSPQIETLILIRPELQTAAIPAGKPP
jgi:hypothetical protein